MKVNHLNLVRYRWAISFELLSLIQVTGSFRMNTPIILYDGFRDGGTGFVMAVWVSVYCIYLLE